LPEGLIVRVKPSNDALALVRGDCFDSADKNF
jgi:hypothetical protein